MRGSYEFTSAYEREVHSPRVSWVIILILVCSAVYVCQILSVQFAGIGLERILGLVPDDAVGKFWLWQFFTYMFLHSTFDIMHIVFNLIMLYIFGRELEIVIGRTKFLTFYFASGIYAGLCYCVYQYFAGATAFPCIGASGAIFGIMALYALMWPDRIILFFFIIPMKVWHAMLIFIVIDLFYMLSRLDTGVANAAHIGGALAAFLMVKGEPFLDNYLDRRASHGARKRFMREFETRKRVDEILDKINREGKENLTREEHNFLMKASKNFRRTNDHEE